MTFDPKQAGQDEYKSAYKNGVGSQKKDDGFEFSFAFSNPQFNCPKGAKEFGDFCYTFHASPLSWQEAENECVKQGAHLASIHHNNEQVQASTHGLRTGLRSLNFLVLKRPE